MGVSSNALIEITQFSFIIATHVKLSQSLNASELIFVIDAGIIIDFKDEQPLNVLDSIVVS